jgi:sulfate adenylyltransferase
MSGTEHPGLIPPHGGTLVSLLAQGEQAEALREGVRSLPRLRLSPRTVADLELLTVGGFSPLTGFMTRREYDSVLEDMRLPNGTAWSMPVTLAVSTEESAAIKEGCQVALTIEGEPLAVLTVEEKYTYDKAREARLVYRTEDPSHPGVAALYSQGDVLLGGPVAALRLPPHEDFLHYRLTPAQTRAAFVERGWSRVVGFQTRNPVHRAHEYIQKCALEIVDGLLLHPLVGETKSDDIPADVRMRCYEVLLEGYYPPDRVLLSALPAAMRYAGPKEAIFHALMRKNYGCSHFIVGRDHAGVGDYYGPFDAQHIFREFRSEDLGVTPLFFDNTFFCRACDEMASAKTCPHGPEDRVIFSGTQVRAMLAAGQAPPKEFTRPEVARVLLDAMAARRVT